MMDKIIQSVLAHSKETQPNECCGLVVKRDGKLEYVRCENVSGNPTDQFVIAPEQYAEIEDTGEVVMIVHSHCYLPPVPSAADKVGIENSGLPWLIVNYPVGNHTITEPSGFKHPLLGRPFVKGALDCYELVKDYYSQELNIELPSYVRPEVWWEEGRSILLENFAAFGFKEIDQSDLQPNDCILMQVGASVPNHVAVYVGDDRILHHVINRLSGHDIYGGYWRRVSTHFLRYFG